MKREQAARPISDFRRMVLLLRKAKITHHVVERRRIIIEDSRYHVVFMFGQEKGNLVKMEVIPNA